MHLCSFVYVSTPFPPKTDLCLQMHWYVEIPLRPCKRWDCKGSPTPKRKKKAKRPLNRSGLFLISPDSCNLQQYFGTNMEQNTPVKLNHKISNVFQLQHLLSPSVAFVASQFAVF